jgi:hypothetical protein
MNFDHCSDDNVVFGTFTLRERLPMACECLAAQGFAFISAMLSSDEFGLGRGLHRQTGSNKFKRQAKGRVP